MSTESAVERWDELTLRTLALSLEWEGSIGVHRHGVQHQPKICISVVTADGRLLERAQREVGCGRIYHAASRRVELSPMDTWEVTGRSAVSLARALEPYLITKVAQARCVMAFSYVNDNRALSAEGLRLREQLASDTNTLNMCGPRAELIPGVEARASVWLAWLRTADEAAKVSILARAIEWEGCIGIARKAKRACAGGYHHEPNIGISQALRRVALLRIPQAIAGCGRIRQMAAPIAKTHDQAMSWGVAGSDAVRLAARLVPFLVTKAEQAKLLAEFPLRPPKGHRLAVDMFLARDSLYRRTYALNHDGEDPGAVEYTDGQSIGF